MKYTVDLNNDPNVLTYIKRLLHAITVDGEVLVTHGYGPQGVTNALVAGGHVLAILKVEGSLLQSITNSSSFLAL